MTGGEDDTHFIILQNGFQKSLVSVQIYECGASLAFFDL